MTHRSVWTIALAFVGGLLGVSPAEAQQDNRCQLDLARATQFYEQGQFDDVVTATNSCVGPDSNSTRIQKVRAYTLRAQSQIAEPSEENFRQAEASVEALIRNSPEFLPEPGAPLLFVDMVRQAKRGSPKVRVGHFARLSRGGCSSRLVQQSIIIPMTADAEWKPKARRMITRTLLCSPSTMPLVTPQRM